jgi:hypothetical protein
MWCRYFENNIIGVNFLGGWILCFRLTEQRSYALSGRPTQQCDAFDYGNSKINRTSMVASIVEHPSTKAQTWSGPSSRNEKLLDLQKITVIRTTAGCSKYTTLVTKTCLDWWSWPNHKLFPDPGTLERNLVVINPCPYTVRDKKINE